MVVGLGLAMATSSRAFAKVMKARLLGEGYQGETNAPMASTSRGLFGNLMLHLKQGANSFHTYSPQGKCVGLVDSSKTKDLQLV